MQPPRPHRKRIKHYEDAAHLRELTFSCYRRLNLLANDAWRTLLSRAIDAATERHQWRLTAFVYMPNHVHLLVYPLSGSSPVDRLLFAIKRPVSFRIKQSLQEHHSPLLAKLTIRQRPNVQTFRYWQEGPGYDRNLISEAAVLAAIDYIHQNPVRRKLTRRAIDWRWSSARWYVDPAVAHDLALPQLHSIPAEWWTHSHG